MKAQEAVGPHLDRVTRAEALSPNARDWFYVNETEAYSAAVQATLASLSEGDREGAEHFAAIARELLAAGLDRTPAAPAGADTEDHTPP